MTCATYMYTFYINSHAYIQKQPRPEQLYYITAVAGETVSGCEHINI